MSRHDPLLRTRSSVSARPASGSRARSHSTRTRSEVTGPVQRSRAGHPRERAESRSGSARPGTSRSGSARSGSRRDEAPATSIGSLLWSATLRAFSGEVPQSIKGQRISSAQSDARVKARLRIFLVALGVLFAGLFVRVLMLQTVSRSQYLAESIDQRTRPVTVRAERGVIFDRNGHELALSVPRTTVYVDPREVLDRAGTARAFAGLLQWTPEQEAKFSARLAEPGAKFAYVVRHLRKEEAAILLNLGLPGVYSYLEPAREVESGVALSVIGLTDPDGRGTTGLEYQYDDLLNGVDGEIVKEVDSRGRSIAGSETTKVDAVPGEDIVLTIDKSIQFQVDQALLQRVTQLGARGGTVIVMDSRSGDIYAMSNVRRDKNNVPAISRGNFAMVEAHEPGSVAKVFSISAALNEGIAGPDTKFEVPGSVTIGQYTIRDAWPHGVVGMNVREIITKSSNVGTMMATDGLGPERLHGYLTAFGFGTQTGLNYPQESRGILKKASRWYGTERQTVSYGYGYAVTPLQLAAAVNTVANDGVHVAPRLVSAFIDGTGARRDNAPAATRRVLESGTASVMKDLLSTVVCEGTGTLAQVRGMKVAGKTGTGYKAQDNGTYVTNEGGRRYFASFAGFFPADAPRVTVLVNIDEPRAESRDRFGGTAAAPVFARIVPTIMHELGIPATGSGTGCKPGAGR